jgi:hypothetical protein
MLLEPEILDAFDSGAVDGAIFELRSSMQCESPIRVSFSRFTFGCGNTRHHETYQHTHIITNGLTETPTKSKCIHQQADLRSDNYPISQNTAASPHPHHRSKKHHTLTKGEKSGSPTDQPTQIKKLKRMCPTSAAQQTTFS